MEINLYRRPARHTTYTRRCLHWAHISKRKGLVSKLFFIYKRLQGRPTYDRYFQRDICLHKGDSYPHWVPNK